MSRPTTPLIKRAALYEWLRGEGFKQHTIKSLVEEGTIPRRTFAGRTHAYYHVPTVAAALQIDNPLAFHSLNQALKPSLPPC